MVLNSREAHAGGISLWQRRGRRSLSDVDTSSEEEEGGLAELRKHAETEDKVLYMPASPDTCRRHLGTSSTEIACDLCQGLQACFLRLTQCSFKQEA